MAAIVSPAGNPDKLRVVLRFGADEAYFGGERFNLRAGSGNFSPEELRDAAALCRKHGARSVFLLNSFLHDDDIGVTREYIDTIKDIGFDAVMVSDPGMITLVRKSGMKSELHLSTQMSTLNRFSAAFWEEAGISRIVLAREVTLDEIRGIREHTGLELEVFCHGALCVSYSGRCLLSRFLSGRDANQGDCSHPCRWKYALVEEKREGNHLDIIEHARGTEILSSKDLMLIRLLPEYLNSGIDAFKIEGRMKSLYYAANTTRLYREAVSLAGDVDAFENNLPFWLRELDLISHRPYTEDLFNEFDAMEERSVPYLRGASFLGFRSAPGRDETECHVKAHNPIRVGDEIEAIYPIINHVVRDAKITVKEIIEDDKAVSMAKPGRVSLLRFDAPVLEDAVFRRVNAEG